MNILEHIVARKQVEVAERKILAPAVMLEKMDALQRPVHSLKKALKAGGSNIIAEFKRRSPSKGWINENADPETVTSAYRKAGACALSVLTDTDFFGGSNKDLILARAANSCPVLRKDFMIDEYQVLEARATGADAILLIAAILPADRIRVLTAYAKSIGLEVLLELHDQEELDKIDDGVDIIGINNRNLKDFRTDIEQSVNMLPLIPDGFVKISESGLQDPIVVAALKAAGFDGFLMGEQFMKHSRPGDACADFVDQLKALVYAD